MSEALANERKVNVTGAQPKRIRVLDQPARRIEPAELAKALVAELAWTSAPGWIELTTDR